jgi:hypothetical protein
MKPQPIDYAAASDEVKAVFDDIKTSRNVPDVNNFWKYLANDPVDVEAHLEQPQGSDGAGRARPDGQGNDLPRGERVEQLRLLHRESPCGRGEGRHDAEPCLPNSWAWSAWRTRPTGWSTAIACLIDPAFDK